MCEVVDWKWGHGKDLFFEGPPTFFLYKFWEDYEIRKVEKEIIYNVYILSYQTLQPHTLTSPP